MESSGQAGRRTKLDILPLLRQLRQLYRRGCSRATAGAEVRGELGYVMGRVRRPHGHRADAEQTGQSGGPRQETQHAATFWVANKMAFTPPPTDTRLCKVAVFTSQSLPTFRQRDTCPAARLTDRC